MSTRFSANFIVSQADPDGQQFDNVSRLYCRSTDGGMDLVLDINCQVYKLREGEEFEVAFADQLSETPGWHPTQVQSPLARQYQYIMHGKVYEYNESIEDMRSTVFMSFGGLLLKLTGGQDDLQDFVRGSNLYLLIRKL